MKLVTTNTVTEAWESWYDCLSSQDIENPSRDGAIAGEVINAITVIKDPTRNLVNSEIRKAPVRYAVGELLWYLSGNNNLKEIQKFTSGWDRMSDDGETVNSNYGHKIQKFYGFNQFEYVKELLGKDKLSRQAVINIKNPSTEVTKDVPCTVCLQFLIRPNEKGEDALYLTTYMRSNDLWMGFTYDVFQFTCLQILLSMQLGVSIGEYTHIAGSLHLYLRDLETSQRGKNNGKSSKTKNKSNK